MDSPGSAAPAPGLAALLTGQLVTLVQQARIQAAGLLDPLTPKLLADVLADSVKRMWPIDADEVDSAARAAAPTPGSGAASMLRLEIALREVQVRALRTVPGDDDSEITAELSSALHNLGTARADAGLNDLAFDATVEAVAIRRRRSESVDAKVKLGQSLHSLSIRHAALGDTDKALEAAHESTASFEELAEHDPSFEPQLARAYLNEATKAAYAEEFDTAEDLAKKAAATRRGLVSDDESTFELAITLLNLGGIRQKRDGVHTATDEAREAIELLRTVRSTIPGAESRLSTALANLAEALLAQGEEAAALEPATEAHEIRDKTALFDPTNVTPAAVALAIAARARRYSDPATARSQLNEALPVLRNANGTGKLRAQIEAAEAALAELSSDDDGATAANR